MSSDIIDLAFEKLLRVESNAQIEQNFIGLMRRALAGKQLNNTSNQTSRWARLPGLCCQAAGGDPRWVESLTAAWLLFYRAANIMDSVEDQDLPDDWWQDLGPPTAINVSSGLFFTAAMVLNELYTEEETRQQAREVINSFYRGFIAMCGGQQLDLATPNPTLDQSLNIARYKSGEFFGLACQAGAQLATQDERVLAAYKDFGSKIGVLVQVIDDLEEIRLIGSNDLLIEPAKLRKSLPIVYAFDVLSNPEQERLNELLGAIGSDPAAAAEFLNIIDASGAVLYLMAEVERLQSQAKASLETAQALEPARAELMEMVPDLRLIQ